MLWLVQPTGVAYETLRRHYAKWLPKPDRGMWENLDLHLGERQQRKLSGAA